MDTNPLLELEADSVVEFVTTASIGDIKTALQDLPDESQTDAAKRVRDIENNREDETPRKGLETFLAKILDEDTSEATGDGPADAGDTSDSASPPDSNGAAPPKAPSAEAPSAPAGPVTLDRDCTLSIRGQVLKCKKGDVLTGAAAAYALAAGAPVTEVPADD